LAMAGFVTKCSNVHNRGRFFGTFWLIFQIANFLGNVLSIWLLGDFNPYIFYWAMLAIVIISSLSFLLMPDLAVVPDPVLEVSEYGTWSEIRQKIQTVAEIGWSDAMKPLLLYSCFGGMVLGIAVAFESEVLSVSLGDIDPNIKNKQVVYVFMCQGILSSICSFVSGSLVDKYNKHLLGILFMAFYGLAIIFTFAAYYYSSYAMCYLMGILWAIGAACQTSVGTAIIGKDFAGELEAFSASGVANQVGVILSLLLIALLAENSPILLLCILSVFFVVATISLTQYNSNKYYNYM